MIKLNSTITSTFTCKSCSRAALWGSQPMQSVRLCYRLLANSHAGVSQDSLRRRDTCSKAIYNWKDRDYCSLLRISSAMTLSSYINFIGLGPSSYQFWQKTNCTYCHIVKLITMIISRMALLSANLRAKSKWIELHGHINQSNYWYTVSVIGRFVSLTQLYSFVA